MPVQINEVIIKAHIREAGEVVKGAGGFGGPGGGGGGAGHGGSGGAAGSGGSAATAKEEIIRECVEAIMELLNRKNER